MRTLSLAIVISIACLGLYAMLQASAREPVKTVVEVDQFEIVCRAKLANLLDRHEWRTKGEAERFKEYRQYMGPECVK